MASVVKVLYGIEPNDVSAWKLSQQKKAAQLASLDKARTQKAKGVVALINAGCLVPTLTGIVQTKEDIELFIETLPRFGRPCPKRPRHGFVDSKLVSTKDELEKMLADTLAADPEGEVMLMVPVEKARYNAIWTPTLLTIGLGNAGATEGINTISVPLSGKMDEKIATLLNKADIDPKIEDPYIEIVDSGGVDYNGINKSYFTQLRCGPKLGKATENYIPTDVDVESVLKVDGQSLIEWEALIQARQHEKGLVIYHPGGSLTDHYTVHARTFNIPVVLKGDAPVAGQTLLKESEDIPFNPAAVLKGAVAGEQVKMDEDNRQTFVSALLVALYNCLSMTGEAGFWLGAAAAMMIRFGVSALKGEARHLHSQGGWEHKSKKWSIHNLNREEIYNKWIPFPLARHRAAVCRIISVLRYGEFGGGAIGGENWAKCGVAILPLINDLGLLAREPSDEGVKRLIRSLNVAVDQAHNNGWWLNKFAQYTSFDAVQTGRIQELIKGLDGFWQLDQARKDVTEDLYQKRVGRWASWTPLKYEAPPLDSAELSSFPGVPGMIFDVKSRLIGKAMRKVIVNPAEVKAAPSGNLYIIPNDVGGFAVVASKDKELTTVWSEPPLEPRKAKMVEGAKEAAK